MVARKKTGKYLVIGAILAFAIIAGFLIWAGLSEAEDRGAPVETPTAGVPTPETVGSPSPSP